MSLFKVAIVGRPNVGKSSLFNKILKKHVSIVHEKEGVTRDRIYEKAFFQDNPFILIDTAGMDFNNSLTLEEKINFQTEVAIEEADILIMVVDAKVGVTNLDIEVSKSLLKTNKKVILAINKIDTKVSLEKKHEFEILGISQSLDISAAHNINIESLMALAFDRMEFDKDYIEDADLAKVALIGKTNVGKSTLLNALLNDQRAVVSEKIATTRDSINSKVTYENETFTFVDTAGIRRKSKERDVLEKFSHSQTLKSIEKSDICLLLIDAKDFLTSQDKKILNNIIDNKKGLIIVVNKWDTIKEVRQEHFLKALQAKYSNFPIIFISALKKQNINKIFPAIKNILNNRQKTITTGALNRFIQKAVQKYHPPIVLGKRLKIYYLTQIGNNPPKFLFFVNYTNLLTPTYKKYLINQFKSSFDFTGTEIIFNIKKKPQRK